MVMFHHFNFFFDEIKTFVKIAKVRFSTWCFIICLQFKSVIIWIRGQNWPKFIILMILIGKLLLWIFTMFFTILVTKASLLFFCTLTSLTSMFYLPILCLSWERFMSVMKNFAMSVCMSICKCPLRPTVTIFFLNRLGIYGF